VEPAVIFVAELCSGEYKLLIFSQSERKAGS
jgi:hypothetical protein